MILNTDIVTTVMLTKPTQVGCTSSVFPLLSISLHFPLFIYFCLLSTGNVF